MEFVNFETTDLYIKFKYFKTISSFPVSVNHLTDSMFNLVLLRSRQLKLLIHLC